MKRGINCFVYFLILSTFPVYAGKVDKIVNHTVNGQWHEALELCNQNIGKLESSYLNVKDTMKPGKQKERADAFVFIQLLKGFLELKTGDFCNAERNLKKTLVFYDASSTNLYLFQAYANILLAKIMEKTGNIAMKDNYLGDANNAAAKFRALSPAAEGEYEKILVGVMGSID